MAYWAAGEHVVERHIRQGKLWVACPRIVVRDDPGLIALYTPVGAVQKYPLPLDGGPLRLLDGTEGWSLVDRPWTGEGVLTLVLPGAAHAVYCFWSPEGPRALSCWYINLQKPLRRTALGFDTLDHTLDVVVSPDRSSWHWKDDDELRELLERGTISAQQARDIRDEGRRAISLVQATDSPYSRDWAHWMPDPAWPLPALPSGWDRPT